MADYTHSYPLAKGASVNNARLFCANLSATAASIGRVSLPTQAGSVVKDAQFEFITNGSETLTITGSYNGGTNDSGNLQPIDASTGLPAASATLAEGVYIIPHSWNFQSYEFTGSSTSDVKTIAFSALLLPK